MPVEQSPLSSSYLSQDIVADVDVISEVVPGSTALVESRGIFSAMQSLSSQLMSKLDLDPKRDSKLFDFSSSPFVEVLNVPDTRNVVSSMGDNTVVYQVPGYDAGSKYFRIPSAVKLNNGRRVAVFDVRWSSSEDIGRTAYNDQCIGVSFSDDRGSTWSAPYVVIDWMYPAYDPSSLPVEHQSGASDPGILYDEQNDVVMVFALGGCGYAGRVSQMTEDLQSASRQQLVFTYSKDHGDTWSQPVSLNNRVFDSNGTTQEWASHWSYLFPTCSSGLTLKRQPDLSDNVMAIPVQLQSQGLDEGWQSTFRIDLLEVFPTYDEERNIVDIKLVLAGNQFGEHCNGANEGQVCEGPDGELVGAFRCYRWIPNHQGTFGVTASGGKSMVSIRIAKAASLHSPWEEVGDLVASEDQYDVACSSLETANSVKPSIHWSDKISQYIVSYVQSLKVDGSDIRSNLILRCSSDLLHWGYLSKLELKTCSGYSSIIPQDDDGEKLLECVYEAWNDGIGQENGGAAKQIKYFSLAAQGDNSTRFSSSFIEQGGINSSMTNIQGFSFNLSKACTTGPFSAFTLAAKPVSKIKVMWGQFTSAQDNIYAVLYDADSNDASAIAYSQLLDLTYAQDPYVELVFKTPAVVNTAHEYFVMFKKADSQHPYPASISSIPARGELGSTGNVASTTTFCSKNQDSGYMKVYYAGAVQYTNSHPLFMYIELIQE